MDAADAKYSVPIFRSSRVTHSPERRHRVTIELRDERRQTRVSVTEDGNNSRQVLEHSDGSWRMVLHGMKAMLDGTSVTPMRLSERK